jgi:hypothetical protein
MVWTAEAMALMSWIVPRMLEACVHVTRTVFSDKRSLRSEARSFGFFETIISEPSGKSRAQERLRKSCVVAEPRTAGC